MADQQYTLDGRSIAAIGSVVRQFKPDRPSAVGGLEEPSSNRPRTFPIMITDNSGSVGTPYKYSWHELYEIQTSGSPAYATLPAAYGGQFGTKDKSGGTGDQGPIINTFEYGPTGSQYPPLINGTLATCELSFDDQTPPNAVYRINVMQLPPLAQYQSWDGTIASGATTVTIVPDYSRAS